MTRGPITLTAPDQRKIAKQIAWFYRTMRILEDVTGPSQTWERAEAKFEGAAAAAAPIFGWRDEHELRGRFDRVDRILADNPRETGRKTELYLTTLRTVLVNGPDIPLDDELEVECGDGSYRTWAGG